MAQTATTQQPLNSQTSRPAASHATPSRPPATPEVHSITEDELKQQLAGKIFYLRGEYLDNELHFDASGRLDGNSPSVSYTLSMVEIDRVHLSKHKLQLEGVRYGLHFLGAGPTEDPMTASDKVRLTPKKKFVKITIDRAPITAKKKKSKASQSGGPGTASRPPAAQQPLDPNLTLAQSAAAASGDAIASEEASPITAAQANQLLKEALDRVFSQGLDQRMIASLPDFWRLYFKAAAAKTNYQPSDPSVLRQSAVDQKARLLTNFEPPSNDFAQKAGVAGVALYHVVVGTDGKPSEIAVGRPIGFGLDENAVASIRKASFQPAMKDGKPVPVLLDLLVQFRIYSKRTAMTGPDATSVSEPQQPPLPGPYSVNQPETKQP